MTIEYKRDDAKSRDGVEYYVAVDAVKRIPISIEAWAQSLSGDSSEGARDRLEFNLVIVDCQSAALFWETKGTMSKLCRDEPFAFVLVESKGLARFASNPDPKPFAEHFSKGPSSYIATFDNLGKTATLVAPKPIHSEVPLTQKMYGHLAIFCRNASAGQIHDLWKTVSATYLMKLQQLSEKPLWLSTSGTGVAWLHIRFDINPKYYTYHPFIQVPTVATKQDKYNVT